MRIDKLRVTCKKCGQVSDVEIVLDAPIAVFSASAKAARCPRCSAGHRSLGLGGEFSGKPVASWPIERRAEWWIEFGEVGESSRTIYGVFTGDMPTEGRQAVPLDPGDFSRCKKLFDLFPEWRADIQRVKAVLPWYAPLIDNWVELECLFEAEERSGWKPPNQMYPAMKHLVNKCRRLQAAARS